MSGAGQSRSKPTTGRSPIEENDNMKPQKGKNRYLRLHRHLATVKQTCRRIGEGIYVALCRKERRSNDERS